MENCKKTLELTVPAEDVAKQTEQVMADLQKKVRLPGFRPGKAPASIIRQRFGDELRREVLEKVIPQHFWKRVEAEQLQVVGRPDISDVKMEDGGPVSYKVEFEVSPEIELKDYKDITVPYRDPEVTDEDVNKRIEELREHKAEYVNIDPRAVEDGDYAVVKLESLEGTDQPVKEEEFIIHVGDPETVADFSDNVRGMNPGDVKEFDVTYPEDFGNSRIAGKTVRFRAELKGLRRKELPEVNDEFAQDLGDFRTLDELREAVKKNIYAERQFAAQQEAQSKLVDKLVEMHEFPVPEAYVEAQIENQVKRQLQLMMAQGVDPRNLKVDWEKLKETQRERATHDVKASLLLARIADRESIHATHDEVDREVTRMAKQQREPVPAVKKKLGDEGLGRIASNIRTDKVLNFLFEHAGKVAEE